MSKGNSRDATKWNPHQKLMEAARGTIIDQKKGIRDKALRAGIPAPIEVHHLSPNGFKDIVKNFLNERGLKEGDVKTIAQANGRVYFADKALEKAFYDYHLKSADLVALTPKSHVAIHQQEAMIMNKLAAKQIKVADEKTKAMIRQIELDVVKQQDKVFKTHLADALERGDAMAAHKAVGRLEFNPKPFYASTYHRVGEITADAIEQEANLEFTFNMRNPIAEKWIQTRSLTLVRNLNNTQRNVISNLISSGMKDGVTVKDMTTQIMRSLPLDERRAKALYNYEKTLKAAGIPKSLLNSRVSQYAEKLKRDRAQMLCLTEMHTATSEANRQVLLDAVKRGVLQGFELMWLTAPDERRCEQCGMMDGHRAPIERGFAEGAPIHPACRCREVAVRSDETNQPAQLGYNYEESERVDPDLVENAEDAERYLRAQFPDAVVDLHGVEQEYAMQVAKKMGELGKQWPDVAKNLNTIRSYDPFVPEIGITEPDDAYSWQLFASNDGTTIALNKASFGNKKLLDRELAGQAAELWHPAGSNNVEGLVAHEWGHQVDNMWQNDEIHTILKYVDDEDNFGTVMGTAEKFILQAPVDEKLSNYPLTYEDDPDLLRTEAFADGFAGVNMGDPEALKHPYVSGLKQLIKELDPRNWIHKDDAKYLSEIEVGSPEWVKADQELAALAKRLNVVRSKDMEEALLDVYTEEAA